MSIIHELICSWEKFWESNSSKTIYPLPHLICHLTSVFSAMEHPVTLAAWHTCTTYTLITMHKDRLYTYYVHQAMVTWFLGPHVCLGPFLNSRGDGKIKKKFCRSSGSRDMPRVGEQEKIKWKCYYLVGPNRLLSERKQERERKKELFSSSACTMHSQKELAHWTVDVTAQIYACYFSGWLRYNFWTAFVLDVPLQWLSSSDY